MSVVKLSVVFAKVCSNVANLVCNLPVAMCADCS